MKIRSFRLRLALLSASLAGSALIGFGIASWLLIYKAKIDRLDTEIKSELLQNAVRPSDPNYWQSYAPTIPSRFTLLIANREGETIYRSPKWPSDLDGTALQSFQSQLNSRPFPPPPPRRPRPEFPPPQREPNSELNPPEFEPLQREQNPPEFEQTLLPEQFPGFEMPPINLGKVETKYANQGTWRIGVGMSPHLRIAIAVSLSEIDPEMIAIRNIFLIAVPVVLVLVAIASWGLSGTALQPIRAVTATIRGVNAKDLNQRIPTGTVDLEFVELLQVFNQMMERLERSFKQATRFSADAAHELKTPLAILQGELELTLQRADPGSELQQKLSNLLDEVRRLSSIVRKLLLLSRADAGKMNLHRVQMDLSPVVSELVEDIEMLAPHLKVEAKIPTGLQIESDRDLLIQVLQNMISNAIKYNLPEGWIKINAGYQYNTLFVTITNSSLDLPAREKSQIFERFYRGDPARSRHIEGLGLGLSLSREIARAHGGDLKLDHTPIGQTAFTLTLPNSSC